MSPAGSWWRGALIAVSVLVTGCTSFQAMDPAGAGGDELKPGDEVEVITKDGGNYRFTVTSVDAEAVSGDGISVRLSEIASLKRKEVSAGKTVGLAAGSYVLVIGLPVVIVMIAAFLF